MLSLSIITALGFALPGSGIAQQKSLKDQIVGSWSLVQAIDILADGTKTNPWGADPKGAYMFSPDGRFTQMLFHTDLPKIDNRMGARPTSTRPSRKASSRLRHLHGGRGKQDHHPDSKAVRLPSSSVPKASGSSPRSTTTNSGARTQPPRPAPKPNWCGDA